MAVPMKEEAKGIFRLGPLDTGHDSGPTSPFLVVGSERVLVAEPGQDGQAPQIVQAIKERGLDLNRVEYVWASHIHYYHVQGLSVLLSLLPKAKFLVHPFAARHVVDVSRLTEQTRLIWSTETSQDVASGVKKCYGQMEPVPADRVLPVDDGQVFDLGGGKEVQVVYAPGHAVHHMGLFDRETRTLFPGDLDTGAGSFGAQGGASVTIFDTDKHIDSMRRYRALNPSILLTFGQQRQFSAMKTLLQVETDFITIERICEVALREKQSIAEIDRRVESYREWVKSERWGTQGMRMRDTFGGVPAHLLANVVRKNPDLEMPKDIQSKMKPREGVRARATQRGPQ